MVKYYRIKEFSKKTSVTVRTLHYYNEISLLKPSHRLASGHRLYSENDMLRLQQITTLKFMGFSLDQINQLMQHPNFNIKNVLKNQAEILAEEAVKIQKAAKLLHQVVNQLDTDNTIDWPTIAKIIEALQMKDKTLETWVTKFFSKEELDEFSKTATQYTPQQVQEYRIKWVEMFSEVKKNLDSDPKGAIGQQLAEKWLVLADEVYGKYPQIRKKLWEAFKVGAVPTDFMPYYEQSVIDYIDKAITYHKKN